MRWYSDNCPDPWMEIIEDLLCGRPTGLHPNDECDLINDLRAMCGIKCCKPHHHSKPLSENEIVLIRAHFEKFVLKEKVTPTKHKEKIKRVSMGGEMMKSRHSGRMMTPMGMGTPRTTGRAMSQRTITPMNMNMTTPTRMATPMSETMSMSEAVERTPSITRTPSTTRISPSRTPSVGRITNLATLSAV
jgi:hypothetical protein